jgi:cleavage and polyadenylation specificity factor subunit 1
VASETEEDHKKHLHLLFQRLSDFSINLSKCLFGATVVPFLGYMISKDGIRPLPERVETVMNYPLPIMVTDLRHFLGLVNFYHRALPDAANKQAPLLATVSQEGLCST